MTVRLPKKTQEKHDAICETKRARKMLEKVFGFNEKKKVTKLQKNAGQDVCGKLQKKNLPETRGTNLAFAR